MRVVLVLAAGAAWERPALELLGGRRDLVVLKRCVDADDLLATAASGQADTALVALEAPGFDLAAVDLLRRHGVRTVGVAPGGAQTEPARVRATRIGVRAVVVEEDLGALPGVLTADDDPSPSPDEHDEDLTDTVAPADGVRGTTIAVWGPAGAPGRTTVATALAAALARSTRTTLVDADPYGGTVAQVLGVLDEVSGLLAAARLSASGLLEERFTTVQRGLDPRLTVVTGLPRADRWVEVRAGTLEALAAVAATQGHVVLDTGFSLERDDVSGRPGRNQLTLAALDAADEVLVVGTADPVGLSRLARAVVELGESHPTTPVRVVVNRMRPSLGWSERDVASIVEGFARPAGLHFLPEDRPTVDRALVTGRTVLETAADAPLSVAVAALAAELTGTGASATSRSVGRFRPRRAGTTRRR